MERRILTVLEMAAQLRISRPKGYELAGRADFPSIRIGKRIVIPEDAFYRWLDEQASKSKSDM